jgi:hypothetical protein
MLAAVLSPIASGAVIDTFLPFSRHQVLICLLLLMRAGVIFVTSTVSIAYERSVVSAGRPHGHIRPTGLSR